MILILSFISGVFGRCGGAAKTGKWYDFMIRSITRDLGCSIILILACWMYLGWHPWVYLAVFVLNWSCLSTYWDWLFKGEDNLGFSGFMVGLASFPLLFINVDLWPIVALRTGILAVVWHCLNKYLPSKILCWNRDVAEEFTRYFVSL
jgi:hypothetical protein